MSKKPVSLDVRLEYPLLSPRGTIEGAIVVDGQKQIHQLVVDDDPVLEHALRTAKPGARLSVLAQAAAPSPKGKGDHPVWTVASLSSVNGKPANSERATAVSGRVARINFARHGEPNGYVLDNGHFVHVKPHGFKALDIGIGDRLEAEGEPRAMLPDGESWVVDARTVNGKPVGKHPARHA
jgi:hypothetical protein